MKLDNPHSAILSAVIFNAVIIVLLIPLALRGVKFRAMYGHRRPAPQPPDLRRRRDHRPVRRDQAHRPHRQRARSPLMIRRQLLTALIVMVVMTVGLGFVYPLVVTGDRAGRVPQQGQRLAREGQRQGRRLVAARPELHRQGRQPARRSTSSRDRRRPVHGYDASSSSASNLGPSNPNLIGNVPGVSISRQDQPVRDAELTPTACPCRRPTRTATTSPTRPATPSTRRTRTAPTCATRTPCPSGRSRTGSSTASPPNAKVPGRRGHRIGIGTRPRHLDRQRRPAGPTRRQGPAPPARHRHGPDQGAHRRAARSGSSARRR